MSSSYPGGCSAAVTSRKARRAAFARRRRRGRTHHEGGGEDDATGLGADTPNPFDEQIHGHLADVVPWLMDGGERWLQAKFRGEWRMIQPGEYVAIFSKGRGGAARKRKIKRRSKIRKRIRSKIKSKSKTFEFCSDFWSCCCSCY